MATTIYFRRSAPSTSRGTNDARLAGSGQGWRVDSFSTSNGAIRFNATSNTVAGPTNGLEVGTTLGADPYEYISEPFDQDVTISGTITFNLVADESDMKANVAINAIIERMDSTGAIISTIAQSSNTTENSTSISAVNFTATPTSTNMLQGDRIRVRVYGDDAGTMANGYSFTFYYGDSSTADSYITFTETFGFLTTAPTGSTLYLTDTEVFSASPSLITSFTGADEDPLSEGGTWSRLNTSDAGPLERIGNAVTSSAAGQTGSYYNPSNYGPDLEAYITVSTSSGTSGLAARVQGEGGANTWDGYVVSVLPTINCSIRRADNGTFTTLLSVTSITWGDGDKLGIRCQGSEISAWRYPSGGSAWAFVGSATDTTYTGAGKLALVATSTTCRMDDLYVSDVGNFGSEKEMWTSRGDGVNSIVVNTATGWTDPIQWTNTGGGRLVEWYSKQLQAFTLTGLVECYLRAAMSAAGYEANMRAELAVCNSDGSSPVVWAAGNKAYSGTIPTSEAAQLVTLAGDSTSVTDGQRLRLRAYIDDNPHISMASGATATFYYDGTSGGASGDSYIILPQSVSEYAAATASLLLPNPNMSTLRRM